MKNRSHTSSFSQQRLISRLLTVHIFSLLRLHPNRLYLAGLLGHEGSQPISLLPCLFPFLRHFLLTDPVLAPIHRFFRDLASKSLLLTVRKTTASTTDPHLGSVLSRLQGAQKGAIDRSTICFLLSPLPSPSLPLSLPPGLHLSFPVGV